MTKKRRALGTRIVCKWPQQLPSMLGLQVHRGKDTTHRTLQTMCNTCAWPQQCWKSCGKRIQHCCAMLRRSRNMHSPGHAKLEWGLLIPLQVRGIWGGGCWGCAPPPWDDLRLSNTTGILPKKTTLWFIGVEVKHAKRLKSYVKRREIVVKMVIPYFSPKKNPGSPPPPCVSISKALLLITES